jgi:hypothetical protein
MPYTLWVTDEDGGEIYGYEDEEFDTVEAAEDFLDSIGSDAIFYRVCWIGGYVVDEQGNTVS